MRHYLRRRLQVIYNGYFRVTAVILMLLLLLMETTMQNCNCRIEEAAGTDIRQESCIERPQEHTHETVAVIRRSYSSPHSGMDSKAEFAALLTGLLTAMAACYVTVRRVKQRKKTVHGVISLYITHYIEQTDGKKRAVSIVA